MSKLFFDNLVELKKIDKQIRKVAKNPDEREELWALVDEIVHHKVMGCILDRLPRQHHEEFLEMYHKSPHDEELLLGYLRIKAGSDLEEIIKLELDNLSEELISEISPQKSPATKK